MAAAADAAGRREEKGAVGIAVAVVATEGWREDGRWM